MDYEAIEGCQVRLDYDRGRWQGYRPLGDKGSEKKGG